MTVLVTRPKVDGEALCNLLKQQGLHAICYPLVGFDKGPDYKPLPTQLNQADIVIVVSQQAVYWALDRLTKKGLAINGLAETSNHSIFPKQLTFLAIGEKTARTLQPYVTSHVIYPAISDSENLLALPELQSVKNKRILILRANGGRELIYDTLKNRFAEVSYNNIYQRRYLAVSEKIVKQWQKSHVKQLVVTSEEQLTHLITQIPSIYLPWLKKLVLYVPSDRIRSKAQQFGFCHTINTSSAANAALQNYIMKNTLTGQHHDG